MTSESSVLADESFSVSARLMVDADDTESALSATVFVSDMGNNCGPPACLVAGKPIRRADGAATVERSGQFRAN